KKVLYIPLRSDKTLPFLSYNLTLILFISHYVQIKRKGVYDIAKREVLYIPLRSDKTFYLIWCFSNALHFISHYVQIKRFAHFKVLLDSLHFFISHYVQIKLLIRSTIFITKRTSLYPTTFR